MSETTKEVLASCNYWLTREMYDDEHTLKHQQQKLPNIESLLNYADTLGSCGKIRESFNIYSKCFILANNISVDKLKNLTISLLDDLCNTTGNSNESCSNNTTVNLSFSCPICEGAICQPITLPCGHTECRQCLLDNPLKCRICGQKNDNLCSAETNILIQKIIEKCWPKELQANSARHEADILLKQGHLPQALERYNFALQMAPNSPLHLCNRAHALLLLNRPQASLADADHAVRLRPDWGKGHYRRGMALSALMRNEEALLALCTSVVIDQNPQIVRHELSRILHRILSSQSRRPSHTNLRTPYNLGEVRNRRNRKHVLLMHSNIGRHRRNHHFNSSDFEDNSSGGEDEISQTHSRRHFNKTVPNDNSKLYMLIDRLYQEVKKIKRTEKKPIENLIPPSNSITNGDLDCILCCRLLWKPVTTPCGHTYCWMCLDRCLDYSSSCPLCVTSLSDYLASSQKTVTEFIERSLKVILPKEYTARSASIRYELLQEYNKQAKQEISVFVCTTSFPCVPCPLFVYEPRYRLMVRRAIENGTRQFGIAASLHREATDSKRYAEYGTMLEIKDRTLLKDGCSILSTVGARRFRVLSGGEKDGYDTVQVEFLRDSPISSEQFPRIQKLHNTVYAKSKKWWGTVRASQRSEICLVNGEMPEPEPEWHKLIDGPAWAWWLLAILPLGQQLQIGILGTTNLEKRLRAIDKALDHMEQRQLISVNRAQSEEESSRNSICRDDSAINETSVSVIQQS